MMESEKERETVKYSKRGKSGVTDCYMKFTEERKKMRKPRTNSK